MSQNINTTYNDLVISDSTNNTTTTLNNTSINFGSNLLTTPLNTTYSNSGITTPISNISFGELFIIRDSVQAVALPIPNDGLTFKVVDTIEVANQENPIGATKTNYGYNSITASNGLTINGLTTFSNVPKSNELPSAPTDLVNLTYLQNNPPPSAVIFYFNNSQVPTPLINTYKLLAVVENELPQSTITTTLSGVGTTQLIQGFSNQLINLNGASFIPSGVWDCNFWASCATSGDATHISVYFSVFGISSLGVETQIGVNSSSASIINTSISQYKTSLALSYTDISIYESLVVKLYAINSRSASTTITNYFESGSSYSHIHTSFGVYVPPNLLSLNNTWTGLNTFTQPPVMNGSNISSASIPDSALSANVPLKNVSNTFTGAKNLFFSNVVNSTPYLDFENLGANMYLSLGRTNSTQSQPPSFTTGSFNLCMGSFCGNAITTGIENFLIGRNTGQNLTTGQRNVALGNASLGSGSVDMSLNTAIGYRAGSGLYSGNLNNTFIGQFSGNLNTVINTLNANNCTFLGSQARTNSTTTLFNQSTAVGANSIITSSNQVVLGSASDTVLAPNTLSATTSITSANLNTTTGGNIRITDTGNVWQTVISQIGTALNVAMPLGNAMNIFNSAGTRPLPTLSPSFGLSIMNNISGARAESCLVNFQGSASAVNAGGFDFYNVSATTGGVKIGGIPKTQSAFNSTGDNIPTYDWVNGSILNGTALTSNNVNLTSDNTIGNYFIPFSKTATTSNALFIDNTISPLTYNPSTGNLNIISITPNFIQDTVQTLASGSTINLSLGSIIVDTGNGASAYTLPSLTASNNGLSVSIQKTSANNHNCVITAGATNQIAAIASNVPANTFTMTNNIYQQSFRFINPNWYPF